MKQIWKHGGRGGDSLRALAARGIRGGAGGRTQPAEKKDLPLNSPAEIEAGLLVVQPRGNGNSSTFDEYRDLDRTDGDGWGHLFQVPSFRLKGRGSGPNQVSGNRGDRPVPDGCELLPERRPLQLPAIQLRVRQAPAHVLPTTRRRSSSRAPPASSRSKGEPHSPAP